MPCHAPVLAISGDMPDYIQTTAPDLLFRHVSLYTETILSPVKAPVLQNVSSCEC
jgi:pyruvate dehydrogenase (quinone)